MLIRCYAHVTSVYRSMWYVYYHRTREFFPVSSSFFQFLPEETKPWIMHLIQTIKMMFISEYVRMYFWIFLIVICTWYFYDFLYWQFYILLNMKRLELSWFDNAWWLQLIKANQERWKCDIVTFSLICYHP